MRYLTFSLDGEAAPRLGVVHGDEIVDVASLPASASEPIPATLMDLIRQGPSAWRRLAERLTAELPRAARGRYDMKKIRWHAPIPRLSKNIVCIGLNYVSHAQESARARG